MKAECLGKCGDMRRIYPEPAMCWNFQVIDVSRGCRSMLFSAALYSDVTTFGT